MVKSILVTGTSVCLLLMIIGCAGSRPETLGIRNGMLSPCPGKPNCVSSMAADEDHAIEPFTYPESATKARARDLLKQVISAHPRTTLVSETDDYLQVEFTTRIFRFVDDVEFYFPDNEAVVHIRSASRLGYSDLGVNRKRMEAIRLLFTEAIKHD